MADEKELIVLDSCSMLNILLPEEPFIDYGISLLEIIGENSICFCAPSYMKSECIYILGKAIYRKRITKQQAINYSVEIDNINILLMEQSFTANEILNKVIEYNLPAWDSGFIDLALTKNCRIATVEKDMRKECKRLGIEVFNEHLLPKI